MCILQDVAFINVTTIKLLDESMRNSVKILVVLFVVLSSAILLSSVMHGVTTRKPSINGVLAYTLAQNATYQANATIVSWINLSTSIDLDQAKQALEDLNPVVPVKVEQDYVEAVLRVYNIYDAFRYGGWDNLFVDLYVRVYSDGLVIAWLPGELSLNDLPLMLYINRSSNKFLVLPVSMKVVLDVCKQLGYDVDIWSVKTAIPIYPNATKLIVMWTTAMDREWSTKYIVSSNAEILGSGWIVLCCARCYDWYQAKCVFSIDDTVIYDSGYSSHYNSDFRRYAYGSLDQSFVDPGTHTVSAQIYLYDCGDYGYEKTFYVLFFIAR